MGQSVPLFWLYNDNLVLLEEGWKIKNLFSIFKEAGSFGISVFSLHALEGFVSPQSIRGNQFRIFCMIQDYFWDESMSELNESKQTASGFIIRPELITSTQIPKKFNTSSWEAPITIPNSYATASTDQRVFSSILMGRTSRASSANQFERSFFGTILVSPRTSQSPSFHASV